MLEAVMRINNPGYSGLAAVGKIERELPAHFVGEIGVKERANPGPSAFGNGNKDGVAAGKLVPTATKIPSHDAINLFASRLRSSRVACECGRDLSVPTAGTRHFHLENESGGEGS